MIQSLAVFYGRNDWHYYLSQGLPLLLTTALPFTFPGIYQALSTSLPEAPHYTSHHIQRQLARLSMFVIFVMSLLSHKEVRFIYPLLPCLHILAAPILVQYFLPAIDPDVAKARLLPAIIKLRLGLLFSLLSVNIFIALYTTIVHAQGPITVMEYLREQHAKYHLPSKSSEEQSMTVGFLMPCHSTPWRSHLVFPTIEAWALTCEPPLHMSPSEKAIYLDEGDQFYANPTAWLRTHMARHPPRPRRLFRSSGHLRKRPQSGLIHADSGVVATMSSRKEWPDYLVFFEQLEGTMQSQLRGSGYTECWRGFNTRWHDDWRRQGDILVWCLWPDRVVEKGKGSLGPDIAERAEQTAAKTFKKTQQEVNTKHQTPLRRGKLSKASGHKSRSWWPRWLWLPEKKPPEKTQSSRDLWS